MKVGDLHAKNGHPDQAIVSYERAADEYATRGSAQRVTALCEKIERVDPDRPAPRVTYARTLIKHDFIGSARDVLANHAQVKGLEKASELLETLAGRANEEVQPILQRFLDAWERGEDKVAEEEAVRMSQQLDASAEMNIEDDERAAAADPLLALSDEDLEEDGSDTASEGDAPQAPRETLTSELISFGDDDSIQRDDQPVRGTENAGEAVAEEEPVEEPEPSTEPEPSAGDMPWISPEATQEQAPRSS